MKNSEPKKTGKKRKPAATVNAAAANDNTTAGFNPVAFSSTCSGNYAYAYNAMQNKAAGNVNGTAGNQPVYSHTVSTGAPPQKRSPRQHNFKWWKVVVFIVLPILFILLHVFLSFLDHANNQVKNQVTDDQKLLAAVKASEKIFTDSLKSKNNTVAFLSRQLDSLLKTAASLESTLEAQKKDGRYNPETVAKLNETARLAGDTYLTWRGKVDSLHKNIAHINDSLLVLHSKIDDMNDAIDMDKQSINAARSGLAYQQIIVLSHDAAGNVDHNRYHVSSFSVELPQSVICSYENQVLHFSIKDPKGHEFFKTAKGLVIPLPPGDYQDMKYLWQRKITEHMNRVLEIPVRNLTLYGGSYTFELRNESGSTLYQTSITISPKA